MWRKRKNPSPFFRMPPPYQPLTGEQAALQRVPNRTRVALMQVTEADTHDAYVVCRGFDPELGRFFTTINVAKPYEYRGKLGIYRVGEVLSCVKPQGRLGDNPGAAHDSVGNPADLNEVIDLLKDADDKPIAWLHIGGRGEVQWFELAENLDAGGSADAHPCVWSESGADYTVDTGTTVTLTDTGGQCWGLAYERLLCRPVTTLLGTVWEPITTGSISHRVTLTAQLNAGSTATANATVRGHTVALTVHDVVLGVGEHTDNGTEINVTYRIGTGWTNGDVAANEVPIVAFELQEDLAPQGSADATMLAWSGSAWAATGSTITVYDALNNWGFGPAGSAIAARGTAKYSSASGRYEVLHCQSCIIQEAQLGASDLTPNSNASATLFGRTITVTDSGMIPTNHKIPAYSYVKVWYSPEADTWFLLNHVMTTQLLCDLQYDSYTGKIQLRPREVGVFSVKTTDEDWADWWDTTSSCP